MRGLNKVMLIGHLGKDPEVPQLSNSTNKLAKFPLATSESYKDKSGQLITQTEWHNVVIWGNLADIASNYLKKGSHVYVEGKIRTRSYDKDGQKMWFTEIVADSFQMLDKKSDNEGGSNYDSEPQGQMSSQQSDVSNKNDDDDLPF
ncbi:MAG: single-stranded DNA-binding protein [Chitinophagaceae bacterium]|nr:MAG: single-stranded DNA-binding protein [Chitinophagaceae bacterium]